jgi:hypothetical protein
MSRAKSWAEDTHNIPLSDFNPASNDYQKIVEDITEFLSDSRFTNELSGKPTPMLVFCYEDSLDQNRGVVDWLSNKYRSIVPAFNWELEVLDLSNLLYHISHSVGQPIGPAKAEGMAQHLFCYLFFGN